MKRSIIFIIVGLVSNIYCAQGPDVWQTTNPAEIPANSTVWNYRYGQFELGKNIDGTTMFGRPPADARPYATACSAMAVAAVAIIGTQLGTSSAASLSSSALIAGIMHDILVSGASAYNKTEKAANGYTFADRVLRDNKDTYKNLNQTREPERAYISTVEAARFGPIPILKTYLDIMQKHVQEKANLAAVGMVLSDGNFSRAIIYLRGAENKGQFVLYDSHAMFTPEKLRKEHMAQEIFEKKQKELKEEDDAAFLKLVEERNIENGSFLAFTPNAEGLIDIARKDGRWGTNIKYGDSSNRILMAPIFIDVLAPAVEQKPAPKPTTEPGPSAPTFAELEALTATFIKELKSAHLPQEITSIWNKFDNTLKSSRLSPAEQKTLKDLFNKELGNRIDFEEFIKKVTTTPEPKKSAAETKPEPKPTPQPKTCSTDPIKPFSKYSDARNFTDTCIAELKNARTLDDITNIKTKFKQAIDDAKIEIESKSALRNRFSETVTKRELDIRNPKN